MAGFVVLDISQKDYDKAIKAKAIEEFTEAANKKITEFVLAHKDNLDFASGIAVTWSIIDEIAEELKQEGGKNGRA